MRAPGSHIGPADHLLSRTEQLTAAFYDWEQRGRGWQLWDSPVELEPPYAPFVGIEDPPRSFDDGRRHTLRSFIFTQLGTLFGPQAGANTYEDTGLHQDDPEPALFLPRQLPAELQLSVPYSERTARDAAERLLLSLRYGIGPVAFEIVGTGETTIVQFACQRDDAGSLQSQLRAFYPSSVITNTASHLIDAWNAVEDGVGMVVDFGLSNEFILPIHTFRGYDVDPLISAIGAMESIRKGEIGLLQVVFQPVRHDWTSSVLRAIRRPDGKPLFADAPDFSKRAAEKVGHRLFSVVIRVAARTQSVDRTREIAQSIGGFLRQFSVPTGNELIPLSNEDYDDEQHELNLLLRTTHRSGMLLNCEELVGLVHLPSASVRSGKLVRQTRRTKAAPQIVVGHELVLGENSHAGTSMQVTLSTEQRTRHMHVIGASGTGKSHLMLNMIIQDIKAGRGVGVLDPHGDLVDRLLSYIPADRTRDVVLFDPADEEFPIGFNILSAHSALEKQLLSSDLVSVFRRLSTSWGDQMTSVLANGILAFLESDQGGTIGDLRRFLIEKEFRREYLASVNDPEVVYYWEREFPLLSGRPQAPLLTRLDTFLRSRLIRNIVAQRDNKLDVGGMMNDGAIFLAKLAQGAIGEENAQLLGTLLVSKFYQIALSRQELRERDRRPFFLYIDEFHHFVTPTLATILSGARKYRLGLTLAHQDMRQLQSRDTELAAAVLTNPHTRICFRVGDADAGKLDSGFASFDASDLQNLGRGEAICRVERNEYDFNLETLPLPQAGIGHGFAHPDDVIVQSQSTLGTPRAEVELSFSQEQPRRRSPRARKQEKDETQKGASDHSAENIIPSRSNEPVSRPTAAKPAKSPSDAEAVKLGRGGRQHKYLQELIKRWAQANGWRAVIEKQILDGLGSVDVSLETDLASVACEITITSTPDHELHNVQKCLAAGYEDVVVLSADEKILAKARDYIRSNVEKKDVKRVLFLSPEELFNFLSAKSTASSEEVIGGYRVEVKLQTGNDTEEQARRDAVSQVILGAMRRMSKGD